MAYFFSGQSHTFNEYLLVPGYSSSECIPDNVSLRTPLTRFRAGEEPALSLNVPMVSAVMQSVSGDRRASRWPSCSAMAWVISFCRSMIWQRSATSFI